MVRTVEWPKRHNCDKLAVLPFGTFGIGRCVGDITLDPHCLPYYSCGVTEFAGWLNVRSDLGMDITRP
jgi:hypothetical protein